MQKEVEVDPALVSRKENQDQEIECVDLKEHEDEEIECVDLEENQEDVVEMIDLEENQENAVEMVEIEESTGQVEDKIHHRLKAHKIGDISLTVTTLVLVIICLCFDKQFAPFIVLLMASRIGSSIYMVIKDFSKQECRKLIVWCALFGKSALTCWQFFMV